ncbi:MAG: sulfotransferase [Eubacteriaceae bacterium]
MTFSSIISVHGAPRSGTSWLGQIFNSSPDVRFKFQPFYSYAFRDQLNIDDEPEKTFSFFKELYSTDEEYLDRRIQIDQGIYPEFKIKKKSPKILALKSVKYHYLIPKFLRELDNIKIICIIREPKAVMNSFLNASKEFDPSWDRLREWRFAQSRNDFRPEYYYGFHRWLECNMLFLEMKNNYPEKTMLVNYHKLCNNPVEETENLFDFCGLKITKQTLTFLEKSTNSFQNDIYSVFRGKKDQNAWKSTLEIKIQNAIDKRMKGTELEDFLKK